MNFSHRDLAIATDHIAARIVGGTVREVRQVADDDQTITLTVRQQGENIYPTLSTRDGATRISLADDRPAAPPHPSAFVMLLRKHLVGARLTGVSARQGDRIVRLSADARDPESGQVAALQLICELMGRHANIWLTERHGGDSEPDCRVLGAADQTLAAGRDCAVGEPWRPPSTSGDAPDVTYVDWPDNDKLEDAFFHALERRLNEERSNQLREERLSGLKARVKRGAKRLRRKLRAIGDDLEQAMGAEEYRRRGELLQGAWGRVKRGQRSVVVNDYYAPGAPEIELQLDPERSLSDEIDSLFKRAGRMERAVPMIQRRLTDTEDALLELMEFREELNNSQASDSSDLAAFEERAQRLEQKGILRKQRKQQDTGHKKKRVAKPYRHFVSAEGWDILVGRGGAQNDELTFHVANGRDIWMHARDWAGAHVVVRVPTRNASPPDRTMHEAALLAAHYSRGAADTTVEVGYSERKHISKPAGLPPGRVFVASQRTRIVTPDAEHVRAMRRGEVDA